MFSCILHPAAIIAACYVLYFSAAVAVAQNSPAAEPIDFSRDIRPILSDKCFVCHGPDRSHGTNDFRLDNQAAAFADRGDHIAIVPGDPNDSELIRRISSSDPEVQMPPPDSGRQLSSSDRDLLAEWIRQGADWNQHWSWIPAKPSPLPVAGYSEWIRNPIDNFVLTQLEQHNLHPSPEADRTTLIRRVSLDLTGLPPTPAEVQAFCQDASPDAWEHVIDRLLLSPRYGERMAIDWLDAARYADTSGYQNDGPRQMWRWRDWVIDAFNQNMPFDQFTTEQIAGDLLDQPTLEQLIATGFNRNHRGNAEGGIIPEEYQVEYVVDRVDTTFAVWLGLTMGCARCHDHKYDPLTQREYYEVFAFFNNIPESGRAIKEGNSPPYIMAPTPEQQQQHSLLEQQSELVDGRLSRWQQNLPQFVDQWERTAVDAEPDDWTVTDGLLHRFRLESDLRDSVTSTAATCESGKSQFVDGRLGHGLQLNEDTAISAGDIGNFGYFDKFSVACWVKPTDLNGTIVSRMTPVEEGSGYCIHLQHGHLQVNFVKRWLDDAIRIESQDALLPEKWYHVTVTYDGSRLAEGIRVYLNGKAIAMDIRLDRINQTFAASSEPFRIGRGHSNFRGTIDEVQIYDRVLTSDEVQIISVPKTISEILAVRANTRPAEQNRKLTAYYIDQQAPDSIRELFRHQGQFRRQLESFQESISTVMVMQEMQPPRPTFVLNRGQYDQPREQVQPGVPAIFPRLPQSETADRLSLAKWLTAPEHPLTARVAVNRIWQQLFGSGLVRTPEDFGVQGAAPTHPELLDWLAVEFVRNGWNVKALQKLILTSATYRQSACVTEHLLQIDPDNKLLARNSRFRLPAEVIRDQALFVSGLLKEQLGGPSVKPYQPEGLWKEIATDTTYDQSTGGDLYRRSLYTYWKRTVAPPTMVTLDATSRESCIVLRSRTNTPLQALALMNETTFVEAARVLAERLLQDADTSPSQRLQEAFLLATCREPRADELAVLCRQLAGAQAAFTADPDSAKHFCSIGQSIPDRQIDLVELAAYTAAASLILNLDEVLNRE